jgi:hypothetical protein
MFPPDFFKDPAAGNKSERDASPLSVQNAQYSQYGHSVQPGQHAQIQKKNLDYDFDEDRELLNLLNNKTKGKGNIRKFN